MSSNSIASLAKHLFLTAAAACALNAYAVEYPIGAPQQRAGMEIAAVYLQPVSMDPEGMMKKAEEADIHIEATLNPLLATRTVLRKEPGFPIWS
jgi:periplasmic iron binding protein